jgi:hypothetical protein
MPCTFGLVTAPHTSVQLIPTESSINLSPIPSRNDTFITPLSLNEGQERGLGFVVFLLQIQGVAFPEEKWLEEWPSALVSPLLTEDVSWVCGAADVVELDDPCCDCLPDAMERQCGVSFVELGVGNRRAVDDGLVVTKHDSVALDGDSKVCLLYTSPSPRD